MKHQCSSSIGAAALGPRDNATYSNPVPEWDEVAVGRVGRSDTERRRHYIAYESHICHLALSTE